MAAARINAKTRRSRSWASGAGLTRSVTVPSSSLRACVALLLVGLVSRLQRSPNSLFRRAAYLPLEPGWAFIEFRLATVSGAIPPERVHGCTLLDEPFRRPTTARSIVAIGSRVEWRRANRIASPWRTGFSEDSPRVTAPANHHRRRPISVPERAKRNAWRGRRASREAPLAGQAFGRS